MADLRRSFATVDDEPFDERPIVVGRSGEQDGPSRERSSRSGITGSDDGTVADPSGLDGRFELARAVSELGSTVSERDL